MSLARLSACHHRTVCDSLVSAATKHEPVKALSKLRVPRLHDLNHFGQRVKTEIVEIAKAAIPSSNQASGEFDCLLRRQACRATSPSLATLEGAAAPGALGEPLKNETPPGALGEPLKKTRPLPRRPVGRTIEKRNPPRSVGQTIEKRNPSRPVGRTIDGPVGRTIEKRNPSRPVGQTSTKPNPPGPVWADH